MINEITKNNATRNKNKEKKSRRKKKITKEDDFLFQLKI